MKEILFWSVWVISGIIMLVYYVKRKRTLLSAAFGMLSGALALLLLHFFGSPLGYQPGLSLFNMATALVLGIPGVIMMFVVNRFL